MFLRKHSIVVGVCVCCLLRTDILHPQKKHLIATTTIFLTEKNLLPNRRAMILPPSNLVAFLFILFLSLSGFKKTFADDESYMELQNTALCDLASLVTTHDSSGHGWRCSTNSTNGMQYPSSPNDGVCTWSGVVCSSGIRVSSISIDSSSSTNEMVFSGQLPESMGSLLHLSLFKLYDSFLSGTLPSSWGNLSSLRSLSLNNNSIVGTLPSSWGNLSSMSYLYLNDNSLTGPIPQTYNSLINMKSMQLNGNSLEFVYLEALCSSDTFGDFHVLGELYDECDKDLLRQNEALCGLIEATNLGNKHGIVGWQCRGKYLALLPCDPSRLWSGINCESHYVTSIDMSGADGYSIRGEIPPAIGNLTSLTSLVLSQNSLGGSLPANLGELSLLINLDLSSNALVGTIPFELGNLTRVTEINLHRNQLTGVVPESFARLSGLASLSLFKNSMNGEYPSEMCSGLHSLAVFEMTNPGIHECSIPFYPRKPTVPFSLTVLSAENDIVITFPYSKLWTCDSGSEPSLKHFDISSSDVKDSFHSFEKLENSNSYDNDTIQFVFKVDVYDSREPSVLSAQSYPRVLCTGIHEDNSTWETVNFEKSSVFLNRYFPSSGSEYGDGPVFVYPSYNIIDTFSDSNIKKMFFDIYKDDPLLSGGYYEAFFHEDMISCTLSSSDDTEFSSCLSASSSSVTFSLDDVAPVCILGPTTKEGDHDSGAPTAMQPSFGRVNVSENAIWCSVPPLSPPLPLNSDSHRSVEFWIEWKLDAGNNEDSNDWLLANLTSEKFGTYQYTHDGRVMKENDKPRSNNTLPAGEFMLPGEVFHIYPPDNETMVLFTVYRGVNASGGSLFEATPDVVSQCRESDFSLRVTVNNDIYDGNNRAEEYGAMVGYFDTYYAHTSLYISTMGDSYGQDPMWCDPAEVGEASEQGRRLAAPLIVKGICKALDIIVGSPKDA